ncbi:hypothetical protein, partial [Pseudomonas putida]|uniref:hypothetical protein n=1 Tax=Pseudomonas putida TaxID=303 RepID=UPI0035D52597
QHQELGAGTNRVPEPGAGSGTAANIKGSVTRSRDNYLENRRLRRNLRRSYRPVRIADSGQHLGAKACPII